MYFFKTITLSNVEEQSNVELGMVVPVCNLTLRRLREEDQSQCSPGGLHT
jgi:hypothetical protein